MTQLHLAATQPKHDYEHVQPHKHNRRRSTGNKTAGL